MTHENYILILQEAWKQWGEHWESYESLYIVWVGFVKDIPDIVGLTQNIDMKEKAEWIKIYLHEYSVYAGVKQVGSCFLYSSL